MANKLFNQDLSDGFFKFDNNENDDNGLDKINSGIAFNLKTINNTMKNFKFVCYHTKPSKFAIDVRHFCAACLGTTISGYASFV